MAVIIGQRQIFMGAGSCRMFVDFRRLTGSDRYVPYPFLLLRIDRRLYIEVWSFCEIRTSLQPAW